MSHESTKTMRLPLIFSMLVFSLGMVAVWFFHPGKLDSKIIIVGLTYACICFFFLMFQIMAFVRAHVVYDEDVENVKYKVLDLESVERV